MTFEQINTIINSIATALKCDYSYSAFRDGKERDRFIVFYYSGTDDLYADGTNFSNIEGLTIEFYSSKKEIENEQTIQSMLNSSGLVFDKVETWINDELLYLSRYTTEVLING